MLNSIFGEFDKQHLWRIQYISMLEGRKAPQPTVGGIVIADQQATTCIQRQVTTHPSCHLIQSPYNSTEMHKIHVALILESFLCAAVVLLFHFLVSCCLFPTHAQSEAEGLAVGRQKMAPDLLSMVRRQATATWLKIGGGWGSAPLALTN